MKSFSVFLYVINDDQAILTQPLKDYKFNNELNPFGFY